MHSNNGPNTVHKYMEVCVYVCVCCVCVVCVCLCVAGVGGWGCYYKNNSMVENNIIWGTLVHSLVTETEKWSP